MAIPVHSTMTLTEALKNNGYFTVNLSLNVINPSTGCHTQCIEHLWDIDTGRTNQRRTNARHELSTTF